MVNMSWCCRGRESSSGGGGGTSKRGGRRHVEFEVHKTITATGPFASFGWSLLAVAVTGVLGCFFSAWRRKRRLVSVLLAAVGYACGWPFPVVVPGTVTVNGGSMSWV